LLLRDKDPTSFFPYCQLGILVQGRSYPRPAAYSAQLALRGGGAWITPCAFIIYIRRDEPENGGKPQK